MLQLGLRKDVAARILYVTGGLCHLWDHRNDNTDRNLQSLSLFQNMPCVGHALAWAGNEVPKHRLRNAEPKYSKLFLVWGVDRVDLELSGKWKTTSL